MQPISEAQFASIVRRFDTVETDGGTIYTKDDQPWEFKRTGSYLIVTHRTRPLPQRYFEIV